MSLISSFPPPPSSPTCPQPCTTDYKNCKLCPSYKGSVTVSDSNCKEAGPWWHSQIDSSGNYACTPSKPPSPVPTSPTCPQCNNTMTIDCIACKNLDSSSPPVTNENCLYPASTYYRNSTDSSNLFIINKYLPACSESSSSKINFR